MESNPSFPKKFPPKKSSQFLFLRGVSEGVESVGENSFDSGIVCSVEISFLRDAISASSSSKRFRILFKSKEALLY